MAGAAGAGLLVLLCGALVVPRAQVPVGSTPPRPSSAVEKRGDHTYRIGRIEIDTARREVVVPGTLNDVTTLEFVANAQNGVKAYETAITLNTDAVSLNAALLLIGLDPANGVVPKMQFDPAEPKGDPIELSVTINGRRLPVEDLTMDRRTGKPLPSGPWVYTGSTFIAAEGGSRFLAEMDGVLIGMMHGPSALIENPRPHAVGGFGAIVLNPKLGVPANTPLTLTIKALNRARTR